MATHHLTLPNYIEPLPRVPVVARYCGPVMAAMRRPGGYQFASVGSRQGQGGSHAWIGRAARQRG